MFVFLVVASLLAAVLGGPLPDVLSLDQMKGRIAGGNAAAIADYPWMAVLLLEAGITYYTACGGSVISDRVIISTGSCLSGSRPVTWMARVSSNDATEGGELYTFLRYVDHPRYFNTTNLFDYDLSLFFTTRTIIFEGNIVKPIPLPPQDQTVIELSGIITGFGALDISASAANILHFARIPIVSPAQCIEAYGELVSERMVCAGNWLEGGVDFCLNDKGGPLVVEGVLVGLMSWGRSCALPGNPGVYTLVSSFSEWINETMQDTSNYY